MTTEKKEEKADLSLVDLSDDELVERKLMLEQAKIQKDDTDIQLAEMEALLEKKIPSRLLADTIVSLEKDIKDCKIRRTKGDDSTLEDATEADIELMKLKLKSMRKMYDLDIPMRDLRLKIQGLLSAKRRPDAPEQQIKKLEREVREKKMYVPAQRANQNRQAYVG